MLFHITILLVFQLIGEVASRTVLPVLPGPVIGMVLLLLALTVMPKFAENFRATANGLLSHLSLLFVPAGVGVVSHMELLTQSGPAILIAVLSSTIAAIAVGALAFVGVAKALGQNHD